MAPRLGRPLPGFICRSCQRQLRRQAQRRFATTTPEVYDVVTVGGGPVGLALLAALKSSPVTSHLKTALIETQDLGKQHQWTPPSGQYSNRASSLTPSSISFLQSSGAWRHIDDSRIQPYDEMQVWDAANDTSMQFDWKAEAERYNAPPRTVATMTENANLTKSLLERIYELNAEQSLLSETKVSSIEMGADDPDGTNLSTWPVLSLSSTSSSSPAPPKIAARLLIGADGFNSRVRTFANIASHGWDYNRHGVVATLKLAQSESAPSHLNPDNSATAYQRFLPASSLSGPIAILPLPDNHASLVWSTTPATATHLKSLLRESLVHVLNAALYLEQTDIKYLLSLSADTDPSFFEYELHWRLKHTPRPPTLSHPPHVIDVQLGSVASFPLRLRHAASLTHPRVALVGDAAHTIHPLAGQGLNLGLADAQSLSECIAYSVEHGLDVGDLMALERYGSDRFGKGIMMAGGVDLLNSVYQLGGSGDGMVSALIGRARGLGMKAIDVAGLKGLFMRVAEGR